MRIDLRSEAEYRAAPVASERRIALPRPPYNVYDVANVGAHLANHLDSLPRDTPLEFFCAAGKRSTFAAGVALTMGFRHVTNLGGVQG